jgi:hypothetical protein
MSDELDTTAAPSGPGAEDSGLDSPQSCAFFFCFSFTANH